MLSSDVYQRFVNISWLLTSNFFHILCSDALGFFPVGGGGGGGGGIGKLLSAIGSDGVNEAMICVFCAQRQTHGASWLDPCVRHG